MLEGVFRIAERSNAEVITRNKVKEVFIRLLIVHNAHSLELLFAIRGCYNEVVINTPALFV